MTESAPLGDRQSLWLLAAAAAALAPLPAQLPAPLGIVAVLLILWRGASLVRLAPMPPRWLPTLLGLAGAAGITVHYHTLFGRDPGVAFLVLLFALKLMEMRGRRDARAVVLLCCFLILCQCFYSQGIAGAALMFAALALAATALLLLEYPRQSNASAATSVALMLAQATPFMLLLFVLFPRIPGPLWGLPNDAHAGLTGLSDTMTPGSIGQLIRSDAIAFRAEFSGSPPAQATLYWRGPVLDRYDGRSWRAAPAAAGTTLPYQTAGEAIDYKVTLEPDGQPWLFALELPGTVPPGASISADYQLRSHAPVRTRLRYTLRSYPGIRAGLQESQAQLAQDRQLPLGADPRARELAARWRAQLGGDALALIRRMLDYYRRHAFAYTLNPPLSGSNTVDDFLFETRRGFCEHFAASFVFMMRAAGLPARVVTGYQGGEINPVDGTLIVRQSDAHAWAEVWLAGRGWLRIDPTAVVAPRRSADDRAAALAADQVSSFLTRSAWLARWRFRWEALDNAWNQWVLDYNSRRQRDFLGSLGMNSPDWQQMAAALAGLGGLLLTALTLWALTGWHHRDPLQRAWERLSEKLAALGLARYRWEGPRDYCDRVVAALPNKAEEMRIIAEIYESLRYGAAPAPLLPELARRIRRFEP
ncbi:protein-glutamine gamma-glutamyltransferase [mine drainage metagenome]|uniref:Protein-glutamine gamma-glutamyltransferase n=1 Tax=mine drainage metagenome TaxID=410659 RepID=A0A1J5R3F2_9ZZZZ